MKKQAKRLSLSRETLQLLDGDKLTNAQGAFVTPPTVNGNTCSVDLCRSVDYTCPSLTCRPHSCF